MAKQKPRSRFWVVTTHVLTTGFAFPFVASLAGWLVISTMTPEDFQTGTLASLLLLAFLAVGYLGGTIYSLSYLRKVASIEKPAKCIGPSVVVFTVLALLGLANCAYQAEFNPPAVLILCVYYAIIIVGFSVLTARGFGRMQEALEAPETPEEPSEYR